MQPYSRTLALCFVSLLATAASAAPQLSLNIQAGASSPKEGGYVQDEKEFNYLSNALPLQKSLDANVAGAGTGIAHASSLVDFGVIKGTVSETSSYSGYLPFQVNSASAHASFYGSFQDTITITSATLPMGTPVALKQTLHASANLQRSGFYSTAYVLALAGGFGIASNLGVYHSIDQNQGGNQFTLLEDVTRTLSVKVGDVLPVYGEIDAICVSTSDPLRPVGGSQVDATHTYGQLLEITTPGASFVSASGARYNAVPEPSTIGALCVGVVALFRRRR